MYSLTRHLFNSGTARERFLSECMDVIQTPGIDASQVDCITLQKMAFVYNAVQSGWAVKRKDGAYVFSRPHGGEKQIYLDSFLKRFIEDNLDVEKLVGS